MTTLLAEHYTFGELAGWGLLALCIGLALAACLWGLSKI